MCKNCDFQDKAIYVNFENLPELSSVLLMLNPLPNNKILDQSKLKAIADEKLKVIQLAKFVLDKTENIVGKEENAGYKHFLLFPQCFQNTFSLRSLKVAIVWYRVKGKEEI